MKQRTLRIFIGLLLVTIIAAHSSGYVRLPLLDRLEAIAYDARVRFGAQPSVDPNIVIVDVDEKSLAVEGRWPWPRSRLADLLDKLFDHYNVRIVGFDMVFPEPDRNSGLSLLQALMREEKNLSPQVQRRLQAMTQTLDSDARFARSLRDRAVVLGYYFSMGDRANPHSQAGELPAPVLSADDFANTDAQVVDWAGYGANLAPLAQAAATAGHFNYLPDMDGISRRVPLLARFEGNYYEALSLAVVRQLIGPTEVGIIAAKAGGGYARVEHIALGEALTVPVDKALSALVAFRGGAGSYTYASAVDVLTGALPKTVLEDKVILIGTTAPGLVDLRATPVSTLLPGVEVHANLISGMLDGGIKSEPPYVVGIELVAIIGVGVILALLLPHLAPWRATILTCVTLVAVMAANLVAWNAWNLVIPISSGVLLIALLYVLNMSFGYFEETRSKRLITGLFGQYVPPDLVKEMSKDPGRFSLRGESRDMTVLFSDVRGFTNISEGMEPRELAHLMNEFLTPLSRVVYEHRGTIDKYMGDCIMAFWGAPVIANDHASQAVRAALKMIEAMEALRPHLRTRGWPELAVGVGLNSGRMSVGNMGSEIRVAYTVMGDAVNLASRLEGITKQYGVNIIVGQDTRSQVQGVVFREVDRVQVKGKKQPIAIFEPIGLEESFCARMRGELAIWHEALAAYRSRDWQGTEALLVHLAQRSPSTKLYQVYLDRIARYRLDPPTEEWQGVYAFDAK